MFGIHCLNSISGKGMELFSELYQTAVLPEEADAVLVRSASMHDWQIPRRLLSVARAGAGVNNIPVNRLSEGGVVVFNTPGANARSVMELALCGMLLGSRDVVGGIRWVESIREDAAVAQKVEKEKARFAGHEIYGKRLGVIGLGAVGGPLANAALALGMEVCGYDPYISVEAAWRLDSGIQRVNSLEELYEVCDIISLHTPLLDSTRKMLNADAFRRMKDGVVILNFARGELVDDEAMEQALREHKVGRYITDFPNRNTAWMDDVVAIPHLGASTEEAEDHCAMMAVRQTRNYLENGNIVNSVNFPNCDLGVCTKAGRLVILHRNIPNSLSRFTGVVAGENINISDLVNRSKGAYAVTMLDLDETVPQTVVETLEKTEGVLRVRVIR